MKETKAEDSIITISVKGSVEDIVSLKTKNI